MGIAINLTLLVQIGNFIIAYLIISYIFLRPGYEVVKSDMNRFRQVRSQIVARQELIAHKQLYKRNRWELFQDHLSKQKPDITPTPVTIHPQKYPILEELSQEEVRHLVHEIVPKIKKKVLS